MASSTISACLCSDSSSSSMAFLPSSHSVNSLLLHRLSVVPSPVIAELGLTSPPSLKSSRISCPKVGGWRLRKNRKSTITRISAENTENGAIATVYVSDNRRDGDSNGAYKTKDGPFNERYTANGTSSAEVFTTNSAEYVASSSASISVDMNQTFRSNKEDKANTALQLYSSVEKEKKEKATQKESNGKQKVESIGQEEPWFKRTEKDKVQVYSFR